MPGLVAVFSAYLCLMLFSAPWVRAAAHEDASQSTEDPAPAQSGSLSVLNYNVHGLPAGFARDRPRWRVERIAPLLSAYEVVALQETFSVHKALDARLQFTSAVHARERRCGVPSGPGLSTYASLPVVESLFVPFRHCHGVFAHANDCLANKGLLLTRIKLPGAAAEVVDFYNLHLDAGGHPGDEAARAKQAEVLIEAISKHSAGHAVVIVGDINESGQGPVSEALNEHGFQESCERSPCEQGSAIERFYIRSGLGVALRAVSWSSESAFVDEQGRPLSDHPALALKLHWSIAEAR